MSVPENDNQPAQQSRDSENTTKPVGMLTYFWWTILALISVTVVLLILATTNQSPQLEEDLRVRVEQRKGLILESVLHPKLFKKTDNTIDEQIDLAFEPIYEGISGFLDDHYSVVGQYKQLGAAARGKLESQMEEWLFSGVHERLEEASTKINETFKAEFRSLISKKIQDEIQTVDSASRDVYEKMLTKAMQNSIQRFIASVPGSGITAFQGAIAGKALFGAMTKAMSKKLLASVVIKTSGKMAAKMAGAGGAAASGAAVGAFLGPVGVAVGGVVGGIVGWLAVDTAVVTIDEHFNRDDFEKELIARINEQKNKIKSSLQAAKSETLNSITPSQM